MLLTFTRKFTYLRISSMLESEFQTVDSAVSIKYLTKAYKTSSNFIGI